MLAKKVGTKPTDKSRRLEISGHVIEVKPTYFGARPLYFGAHFTNSPYYQIPDDQHDAYDKNVHAGKNANMTNRAAAHCYKETSNGISVGGCPS